jgi:tripartite-type tricarboxylate transporter receptor subunit TctC
MFPDIPTLEEQGFDTPGTVGNNGYLWIRRSAPQEAKDYWINILEAVLTNPESESKLEEILGVDMGYLSGDDLEKLARELYDQRAGYIKEFGISVNK